METMPSISFNRHEDADITRILHELDPAHHDLIVPFRQVMTDDDWSFLHDFLRTEMRMVLEMGLMARSVAGLSSHAPLSVQMAAEELVRASRWASHGGCGMSASEERLVEIAGEDPLSPLRLAIEALMELAEDRLFGTIDDEYVRLSRELGPSI